MPELSAILAFIKAILWTHLVPVVISLGIPPIVEVSYKSITGKDLPHKFHFRWIVILGALITVFLAWNDEYMERLRLQQKESTFNVAEERVQTLTEAVRKAEKIEVDLHIDINELKRDKSELLNKLESQRETFIAEIATLSQSNIDKQQRLDDKEKRRVIRGKITSYIKEGEELKLDLTALNAQADPWVAKVQAYLGTLPDSSFKTQFAHPPIPPSYAYLMNSLYTSPAWIKVEAHLMALRKFLNDLRE